MVSPITRLAFAIIATCSLSACEPDGHPKGSVGYLEVRGGFDVRPGDSFTFGDTPINKSASGKLEGLIKAPLGISELSLRRDTRIYPLCSATIRQNRITSVTVQNSPRGLVCTVKD